MLTVYNEQKSDVYTSLNIFSNQAAQTASEEQQPQEEGFNDNEEQIQNRQVVHIVLDNYHLKEQSIYKYETKFTKEETRRLHEELKNLGFDKNTTYIQTKLDHLKPDQRCTHKDNFDDIFEGIAQICYKNQPKKIGQYNLNIVILQGFIYSQNNEYFMAVPMEFMDGSEQFLSGISDFSVTALANKLANTP